MAEIVPDPWQAWRRHTAARIALGRAGVATPTDEALRFGLAHAMARDAIHAPLDVVALQAELQAAGWPVLQTRSRAGDRTEYLRRPDLGRQLHPDDAPRLRAHAQQQREAGRPAPDLCIVVGDGLSSLAVQRHTRALLAALPQHLPAGFTLAPIVVVTQARVAVADEIGELLGAAMSAIFIGERPGLSSPDSLGIYLTHGPQRGRHDAERNCISNVRPEGLRPEAAAFKLAWLMKRALQLGCTGVNLKDESDLEVLDAAPAAPALSPAPPGRPKGLNGPLGG